MVTLTIKTRFSQLAVKKALTSTEKIESSEHFKEKLNEMSTEASIEGGYGVFSANAADAYTSLVQSVRSGKDYEKNVDNKETEYNEDFLQTFQKIATTIKLDGKTLTKTTKQHVNSVSVEEPWTPEKLRKEAEDHMKYYYPGAKKNTLVETVCTKIGKGRYQKHQEGGFLVFRGYRAFSVF